MSDAAALRRGMVDRLVNERELAPEWRSTFLAVPRHAFIPDLIWRRDPSIEGPEDLVPVRRSEDPATWLKLAYTDDAVITQVDDGTPVGPGLRGLLPTSSASMPLLVSRMLTALDAYEGNRVLEIGTGTGWNAALLAHRLGPGNVTTIEVDPGLAESANKALIDAGYGGVRVLIRDGVQGYLPGAPYDRIISTASVHRFPYPWVEQTRPGGRIITPWAQPYLPALVAFTVGEDGTATGSVADPGMDFMSLRNQRLPIVSVAEVIGDDDEDNAAAAQTDLHPYDVSTWDAAFTIGQRVPNCTKRTWLPDDEDDHATFWLLDQRSGSWARLRYDPDFRDTHEVRQSGPRRLWDEVEAAYHWWVNQGRPATDRWRFEVGPDGQQVTLPLQR